MSSTVHLKNNYPLNVVNSSDIINNLSGVDDEERIIIKDIIKHMDAKIGDGVSTNKTVLIPYVGSIRKCLANIEFYKNYKDLRKARASMNKEDYKAYAKKVYNDCVNMISEKDNAKKQKAKLIAINRKKYNEIYKSVGETFANTWIYSLSLIEVIEFNQEIEDMFKQLHYENCNRKFNNSR